MYYKISFFVLFSVWSISAMCQTNFKIGYSLGYTPYNENNRILQAYNASGPVFERPFGNVHVFHGVHLGARQKFGALALEFTWENFGKTVEAVGFDAADVAFARDMTYTNNGYFLSVENYFGGFGYGAGVGRESVSVKTEIPSITDVKRTILKDSRAVVKLNLIFTLQESDFISLNIKPFLNIPLDSFEYGNIDRELNNASAESSVKERSLFYGLSIIFYNGRQD